jgi:uncharacterized membrane protein YqjE
VPEEPLPDVTGTATRLWASAVEAVHLRLELLALELAEERKRITDLVLSALMVAFAVFMLFLALNVALLVLLWDTHRDGVAVGMCVVYALLAAGFGLYHRHRHRRTGPPFAATTAVLAEDERALRELL